jgi:hypothetical protein
MDASDVLPASCFAAVLAAAALVTRFPSAETACARLASVAAPAGRLIAKRPEASTSPLHHRDGCSMPCCFPSSRAGVSRCRFFGDRQPVNTPRHSCLAHVPSRMGRPTCHSRRSSVCLWRSRRDRTRKRPAHIPDVFVLHAAIGEMQAEDRPRPRAAFGGGADKRTIGEHDYAANRISTVP